MNDKLITEYERLRAQYAKNEREEWTLNISMFLVVAVAILGLLFGLVQLVEWASVTRPA